MDGDEVEAFWRQHYEALASHGPRWLDYSNERTQAQSFSLALDAAGPLDGRDVLDLGCGHGQLSLASHGLGARSVTGVDLASGCIERNSRLYPEVQWIASPLLSMQTEETYDLVFSIEVLQYLAFPEALVRFWSLVRPGGRLIIIVPNRDCPIVERAMIRFGGRFLPPSVEGLRAALPNLPELAWWRMRGLFFLPDQSVSPYGPGSWTTEPDWTTPPNRLQLAVQRA
jgi:SAM-dependent methyltransferase